MNTPSDPDSILLPEALQHYDQIDEANRLTGITGQLELVRTRQLLTRFLPAPPATVIDVGGGAGIHAFWLAEQGYDVQLIDAVPHHIETARKAASLKPEIELRMEVGDARQLSCETASADAVLLLGPLYHLTSQADRIQCLREAKRVLRPGGVALGAAIPRFASFINCLSTGQVDNPQFRAIVDADLKDGQHRNPTENPYFFTTTFFHHPDELVDEFATGGFAVQQLLAIEGPGKLIPHFEEHWNDPQQREWILNAIRKVEQEPHLLGLSTHILAIGRYGGQDHDTFKDSGGS